MPCILVKRIRSSRAELSIVAQEQRSRSGVQPDLPNKIKLPAASSAGVFGKRSLDCRCCGLNRFRLRAPLLLPQPPPIGIALTRLRVLLGLANAGGIFGLLVRLGGPRLLGCFPLRLFRFSRPLWQPRAS